MAWQQGVAKVVKVIRDKVVINCPHCPSQHTHSRQSLGSKEVVAGCHAGRNRCRSYAIPKR
jgi:hypothetical protein